MKEAIDLFRRTVDIVKVSFYKLETIGVSMSSMCTGIILVYFGVTTYYFAPEAAISKDTYSFVMIMNRILILMIVGLSIIASLF